MHSIKEQDKISKNSLIIQMMYSINQKFLVFFESNDISSEQGIPTPKKREPRHRNAHAHPKKTYILPAGAADNCITIHEHALHVKSPYMNKPLILHDAPCNRTATKTPCHSHHFFGWGARQPRKFDRQSRVSESKSPQHGCTY